MNHTTKDYNNYQTIVTKQIQQYTKQTKQVSK